uniref:Uncharacterized protein n=1 Tax=Laticauda laticaudata TaxID=8630 RepID=A0A8C5S5F0_LATLA
MFLGSLTMPSHSDSSCSLTGRTSHSFTHLRVRRAWLQIILLLGFIQMILGILIVTLSLLVTTSIPSQHPIGNSCPIWAGFPVSSLLERLGMWVFWGRGVSGIERRKQLFSLSGNWLSSFPRLAEVPSPFALAAF